jgi:hypothetical protein
MSSSEPHAKFKGVVIDNAAFSRDFHQYSPTVHNKNCPVSIRFHELGALLTYFLFGNYSSATQCIRNLSPANSTQNLLCLNISNFL